MRVFKKFILVLLLPILLGGCRDKESIPPQLIGSWLWEGSSGGIAGMIIKPNPGERVIVQFTAGGQFSVHQNDTLAYSGTYRLTKERSIYSGKDEANIEINQVIRNNQLKKAYTVVVGGVVSTLSISQLSIGDNMYDGYGSSFVRN